MKLQKKARRQDTQFKQGNKISMKGRFGGGLNGSSKTQWFNKYATCDAQLKFRLELAIKKYGRIPHIEEETNLIHTFIKRFGSWRNGLQYYGYKPLRENK